MEEEFDFDKPGKRMPYKVPPFFFDNITETTLAEAKQRREARRERSFLTGRLLAVAAGMAILLVTGYLAYMGNFKTEKKMAEAVRNEVPATDTLLPAEPAPLLVAKPAPQPQQLPQTKPETTPKPQPAQQQATAGTGRIETMEELLASISDEELQLLAAIVKTEQYVYEQTID